MCSGEICLRVKLGIEHLSPWLSTPYFIGTYEWVLQIHYAALVIFRNKNGLMAGGFWIECQCIQFSENQRSQVYQKSCFNRFWYDINMKRKGKKSNLRGQIPENVLLRKASDIDFLHHYSYPRSLLTLFPALCDRPCQHTWVLLSRVFPQKITEKTTNNLTLLFESPFEGTEWVLRKKPKEHGPGRQCLSLHRQVRYMPENSWHGGLQPQSKRAEEGVN